MANPAHEALLRQGVEEWNDWRAQNGSVTPDLTGLSMPAARLDGIDLSHARLKGVTLIRSKLNGADLRHADLRDAKLHEIVLNDADLFRTNLENAVLASAKLRRARLCGANLAGAQITVVDFRKADFRDARLKNADLRESLGTGASLEGADLTGAELSLCNLSGCNLEGTRGLTSRQIERAITDAHTRIPESLGGQETAASIETLCRCLESLKARASGESVPETEVSSYHSLLDQLNGRGVDTGNARIRDEDLVRPVTTWARTRGEEAFESNARMWVDGALFRRRVEDLIAQIK
ncbi:MAG: hypothetical protein BMS9Abin37_1850 [Acidobacteriota bacterium]|nr:MAG: hypothetical protein BMS9Abin37_1850 [Acidobacteriota bacterium]